MLRKTFLLFRPGKKKYDREKRRSQRMKDVYASMLNSENRDGKQHPYSAAHEKMPKKPNSRERDFTKLPGIKEELPKGLRNEDLTGFARGIEIQRVFYDRDIYSIVGNCLWPKFIIKTIASS
ncbi:Oidioi.mRNA.OKI2018_I69.chr1.g3922.t1.cds [Oikopleura dioica]|uniref:Oidioi.mRNA.OKI2018_I69.chr1.g3922.t1.cds n=1 Tax=Oikopleura dioica TaxID=34765 RepID=A0ABN7SXD4_OIKDI|nr:Oidioi.mRNA.OKI2018_I69.chr1.g3922.t1.cds [Oikopleura dioica]